MHVFSKSGRLYAAADHYVKAHEYRPPEEFIEAMTDGPVPPGEEYFDRLTKVGLEWRNATGPDGNSLRLKRSLFGDNRLLASTGNAFMNRLATGTPAPSN